MPYPETIKYIKEQLDRGLKSEDVKKLLLNAGYQNEVIDQLLEKAGVIKEEKKASGIEKVLLKDLGIGAVLLIIIGSLVYINFFAGSKEMFSPKEASNFYLDFSKISPLKLNKDDVAVISADKIIKDNTEDLSQILWSTEGTVCVNVQIPDKNQIVLRSLFIEGCPLEENIEFKATNYVGETDSEILKIKII